MRAVLPGSYTYLIRSDQSLLPARGPIGGGDISLAIAARGRPGDGLAERRLERRQHDDHVHLEHAGERRGPVVDVLGTEVAAFPKSWKRAGEHVLALRPGAAPGRLFTIELAANATGGRVATASTQLAVTRTLGSVAVTRLAFSPNADGRADQILQVLARGAGRGAVADHEERPLGRDAVQGAARAGLRKVDWNGAKRVGKLVDGMYEAIVEATDPIADSTVALPFAADTRQPRLRILQRHPLQIWVSEPALPFASAAQLVYEASSWTASDPEGAAPRDRPRGRVGRGREQEHPRVEAIAAGCDA